MGYDPYISVDHAWKLSRSVMHALSLDEVIEKSDYITLHVPLMDSNRNMIDGDAIAHMKKTAALLNFSRGGLVNIDAVSYTHLDVYKRQICWRPSAKVSAA